MSGPFVLPVHDISRRPGEMREFRFDVAIREQWGEGLVSVPAGEQVDLDVRLESVHEGILVTASIATDSRGVCGRCLTDIAQPVEVEFQELFGYPGEEATDFEVQDDHVDLETPVRDAIVLSLPFQPVCQPDCLGLDPESGEKLTSQKAHELPEPVDPRWAALQTFTHDDATDGRAAENTEES